MVLSPLGGLFMHLSKTLIVSTLMAVVLCSPTGCSRRSATGAAIGGGVGAGAGAAIGSASGNTGTGAAIGGTVGAVSGAAIGEVRDRSEAASKEQQEFMRRQKEMLHKQQRELEDLKRQKFHDEYFRSRYPEGAQ
jgi:osmotically inducible lipoprotein OsmB